MEVKLVVADASFLINLMAHRREDEVLLALNFRLVASQQTVPEVQYLIGPPDEEGCPTQETIDLTGLRSSGLLDVHVQESDELSGAFIRCAEELRDKDAWPVALAATLGVPLATADAHQRNVARSLFPAMEIISTLSSLRAAAAVLGLDDASLRCMALDLRTRGRFSPPKSDPDRAWYEALLREGP